jgi:hypothetical protein
LGIAVIFSTLVTAKPVRSFARSVSTPLPALGAPQRLSRTALEPRLSDLGDVLTRVSHQLMDLVFEIGGMMTRSLSGFSNCLLDFIPFAPF